jgi:hypothetical protein
VVVGVRVAGVDEDQAFFGHVADEYSCYAEIDSCTSRRSWVRVAMVFMEGSFGLVW